MPAIHQLVAGLTRGDAISNEARRLQALFNAWGYESQIYADTARILPEYRREAGDASRLHEHVSEDDIALLHLSIGSSVNDVFAKLSCRKALLYHNITPPHFFELVNRQTAAHLAHGRDQLAQLCNAAQVNLADSQYNALELVEMGYADPRVFPLVLDFSMLRAKPDPKVLQEFGDGKKNILFVGRCAPNKCIDDVLRAFHVFHRCVDANSRLIHVGSFAGTERYYHLLQARAREMGLNDAMVFAGAVTQSQLNAYYTCADLFLCMSQHEGFCIPIIEAMLNDVPVLAYATAAIPGTMDGAGVLFYRKDFESVSEMMGRLCHDSALRNDILQGQRDRIARFEARDIQGEVKAWLGPLLQ